MYFLRINDSISALCVQTDGMDDPAILSDTQVDVTDKNATGSLRSSDNGTFTTFKDELNVTITLINPDFPTPAQLGKFEIIDENSTNVGTYELFYKSVFDDTFTPYNSDPSSDLAEIMSSTDSILFPSGIFATEVRIVVQKIKSAASGEEMKLKIKLFACFQPCKLQPFEYVQTCSLAMY